MTAVVTALTLLAWTSSAHAQAAADKAAAEQLFKQARALMTAKNYEEACPKLEASLQLDPALGTRLNLASCYEEIGKLASAWGMYHEAADLAEKENQPKRVKFALEHAKALEPRLPTLIILAPHAEELPELKITRDGTVIEAAVFGTAIYVDPGPRVITATAAGYKEFTTEVNAEEGKRVTFSVPQLEEAPKPITPDPTSDPSIGAPTLSRAAPPDPGRTRRLAGLGVGAAGVVSAAVGLGFGLSARSKWNEAFDGGLCDEQTKLCTPQGQRITDLARRRANFATAFVSVGAAMVATGAILYFTAPKRETRTAHLVPSADGDTVSVHLLGAF